MASIGDTSNLADQYPVHIGLWTNWSRGRVMGATYTFKQSDANVLIAFVAFFIAFVSTRFWRILCFVLHRLYSTPDPQSAVYYQCQAILRNCSSPEEGIRLLFQLLWSGRSQKRFRSITAAITAMLCVFAFTAAGIFSSLISTSIGNEVLVKSANCGYMSYPTLTQPGFSNAYSYKAERLDNAANYAQRCYSNNSDEYLNCGSFVKNKLSAFTIDKTAGCPFRNGICRETSKNLHIDTGYLDSHSDFGLNTPPDQRILWRNVLHCAPLVTNGFTSSRNTPSLGNLTFYDYGPLIGDVISVRNHTYAAQSVESQYAFLLSPDTAANSGYYRLE